MNKNFDVEELVYRKIITKKNKKEQQKQYNNNKKERNIESRKLTIDIENIKTTTYNFILIFIIIFCSVHINILVKGLRQTRKYNKYLFAILTF